jgi:hypothetical protein
MYSVYSLVKPENATNLNPPSWTRAMLPLSAWQRRTAESTNVSRTVRKSKLERLIILSTSAVAVCCWRASASSRCFSVSFFFEGLRTRRALAFVPVERSL